MPMKRVKSVFWPGLLAGLTVTTLVFLVPVSAGKVPRTHPSAFQVRGKLKGERWLVQGNPGAGRRGATEPCLTVVIQGGDQAGAPAERLCGSLDPAPLLVGQSLGEKKHLQTVIGMAFRPEVDRVRYLLKGRRWQVLTLRHLGRKRAKHAKIEPLSYGAAAFVGNTCLERIVAMGKGGKVVAPKLHSPCSPGR